MIDDKFKLAKCVQVARLYLEVCTFPPKCLVLEWWCFGAAVYCVTTLTNKIPHCMFCDNWQTCPTKLFYSVLLIGESDALVSIVPNANCMILFLESRTLLE